MAWGMGHGVGRVPSNAMHQRLAQYRHKACCDYHHYNCYRSSTASKPASKQVPLHKALPVTSTITVPASSTHRIRAFTIWYQ